MNLPLYPPTRLVHTVATLRIKRLDDGGGFAFVMGRKKGQFCFDAKSFAKDDGGLLAVKPRGKPDNEPGRWVRIA